MIKVIFILLFCIIISICLKYIFTKIEKFETNDLDIQLVISRYNENLNWLNDIPFSKYKNIIYNKGFNNDFYNNDKSKIVTLKNIGKCDATYLYHIINNYDMLSEVTIFVTGSLNLQEKYIKAKKLIEEVEIHKDTVFISAYYEDVKKQLYNFQLSSYEARYKENNYPHSGAELSPAKIRPFGKWFDDKFGNIVIQHVSYFGIIAIHKKDILQHPKTYYEKLYTEFDDESANPEVGHYFERAWEAVFYPLNNPKYI